MTFLLGSLIGISNLTCPKFTLYPFPSPPKNTSSMELNHDVTFYPALFFFITFVTT